MDVLLDLPKPYIFLFQLKPLRCMFAMLVCVLLLPSAQATVYELVPIERSATEAIDSGLDNRGGGKRKYILNGQKVDGRLSYSSYTPQELTAVLSHDWQNKAKQIKPDDDPYMPELGIAKPLISNGSNWSMFANLNLLGIPEQARTLPTLAERYIVFAMRPDQKSKSDVWILNLPENVNPLSLMVPAFSGGDVPVYPGNELSWSLVEATQSGESELHIYSGSGAIAEYVEHYKSAYTSQGFRYDAIVRPESDPGDTRLLFSRGASELDITLQLTDQGITSIIQLRKKR